MKPALVLGLALAANTMTADSGENNELFVAPTGELAEWAKKHPHVMFDEVADDELLFKVLHLPGVKEIGIAYYDAVDDDEFLVRPVVPHIAADDAADDELALKYVHLPHLPAPEVAALDDDEFLVKKPREESKMTEAYMQAMGWKPRPQVHYPQMMAYDDDELLIRKPRRDEEYMRVADDELLVTPARDLLNRHPYDSLGHVARDNIGRPLKPVLSRFDEVADDEFGVTDFPKIPRSRFNSDEEYERYLTKRRMHRHLDDAADDELAMWHPTPEQYQHLQNSKNLVSAKFDEVADDELQQLRSKVLHLPGVQEIGIAYYAADDELLVRPLVPHIAADDAADDELVMWRPTPEQYQHLQNSKNLVYAKFDEVADDELRLRPISVLPTSEYVAADDELSFMPIPPKVFVNRDWIKPAKIPVSEALIRDDEADDELLYMGQLIRDGGYIPRLHFDDELRAEKPSHLKAQERSQLKNELPKRKLRPTVDQDYVI